MLKRLLVGVTAILALSTTAFAASADHKTQDGMYMSAMGGWNFMMDANVNNFAGTGDRLSRNSQVGYNFGGAIGYQMNNVRVEFAVDTLRSNDHSITLGGEKATGDIGYAQILPVMVNAYYDFNMMHSRFVPYVGAGIGYAQTEEGESGAFLNVSGNTNANVFAYNFMGGVKYNLNDKINFFAEYRYLGTSHASYMAANDVKVGTSYGDNMINFGVTLHLG
tara:strand:- start:31844 stop:32506 length:663 start_codon:yes stop_codon:yes gene_type:complete